MMKFENPPDELDYQSFQKSIVNRIVSAFAVPGYFWKGYAPHMNEAIMNLLSDNPAIAYRIYQDLCKRWPQINEHTRITFTAHTSVYFEQLPPQMVDNVRWVRLSGWKRGMQVEPISPIVPKPIVTEEIHLETFGWSMTVWDHEPIRDFIHCAYHAKSDTFYVYRRQPQSPNLPPRA